ncbi:Ubiquitin carboxyl-terminal hydrolase 46, partial [Rhizoclosmatium hyalinum]
ALYFCKPFRSCVLGYSYPVSSAALAASDAATGLPPLSLPLQTPLQTPIQTPIQSSSSTSSAALPFGLLLDSLAQEKSDETLLTTLRDLFTAIASAKKKSGVVKPVNFVSRLKKENELFQGVTQQDAQEFLNFLLNAIAEILIRHKKEMADKLALLGVIPKEDTKGVETSSNKNTKAMAPATWIHSLFEGLLSNETKCLTCETTTTRTEPFLDLSIDISQHSSISTCLRNFSVS